jgi:CheY-like chemotaxis protein
VLDPSNLDVNEILTSVSNILTRVVGEDVELRMQLAPNLGRVRVDRSQLEQVIMNLVVNARDAMPDGGRIAIRTEAVELDEELAGSRLEVSPGPYVMVSVSDTGCGMNRETQARIFEPFFTTKEQGKGTGLGLSTAFGIVKQSGGSIWLYSEPGAGTTFKIYLPRVASGTEAPMAAATELPRGDETILLVEDEEQVRVVAASILRRAGYSVLAAASPGEAISIAESAQAPIDLLVTDVIMPKMNGRILAERIVAGRPTIKVLFMSGYTDDIILHHGVLDGAVAFLQKPLTRDSLTRRVRQVLDGSPAGGLSRSITPSR